MRWGEVSGTRFDVDAHHPEHINLIRHIDELTDTALISEIVTSPLMTGFAAGKAARAQPGDTVALQIRPTQILVDGEIEMSGAYGIRVKDISNQNYLQDGEVLFNNTNSTSLVGKSAVFREVNPTVCSNHVTRLQLREGIEPDFVALVLNVLRHRGYFARLCTNFNNQAGINTTTLANVRIPLPLAPERQLLLADMDDARAERKTKLAQADALLASIDDFVLDALGIAPPQEETRGVFAVRGADMRNLQFSPSRHVPELQSLLNGLRNHAATSKTLGDYVEVNPKANVSELGDNDVVGFIPMSAVADGATGEHTLENRSLKEVRKGYTSFRDGDVLWAKITPSMQNGKSCIVEGLPNGIGFGSTEFHVLRVKAAGTSKEFVKEFVSQKTLRQVATNTFTGSAGQQRVPADFLADLPFPELSEAQQNEIVSEIQSIRSQARRLRAEAEAGWQEAKQWFEEQLLGSASS